MALHVDQSVDNKPLKYHEKFPGLGLYLGPLMRFVPLDLNAGPEHRIQ